MRWLTGLAVVIALGAGASGSVPLTELEEHTLTAIDSVPSRSQLSDLFNGDQQAVQGLTAIAEDGASDPGVRLRALHALGKYCPLVAGQTCQASDPGWPAHEALASVLSGNIGEYQGTNLLLLRAAVESLGPLRVDTDINLLLPLLDHPSRDVRASTAHALGALCNTQAINALRVRYQHETVVQVRLAISDALRILAPPPPQLPCQ
jgi:HEAT repeat protein